jgi:NAD(P)-dependent dehydrogenase (short-subunit alcohol dehydrogenase family)
MTYSAETSQLACQYQCPENAFADRVILVTGAGDGIGRAVSKALASKGATIVIIGRTQQKLESLYDEIVAAGYPEPVMVPMNLMVATPHDYEELAAMTEQELGRLDGVLHNASLLGDITPLEIYADGTWDSVMQVNVNAQFFLTRAMLPLLKKSDDARLLFTSSSVGRKGRAFWGAYSISKFATEGMMQVFADELENTSNIRVNSINPGATRTNMRAMAYPAENPENLKTPDQIVPAYLYLLGPDSKQINGQAIDAQPK